MSNESTNPNSSEFSFDSSNNDLDAFSAEFFSRNPTAPTPEEPASSDQDVEDTQDVSETDEDTDANNEDTHSEDEDTLAPDDDNDEDDDEADDPDEKKDEKPTNTKKNRFQERINELTAGKREAERKASALEARILKLEQQGNKEPDPEPTDKTTVQNNNTGPSPDELNQDGTEKYPLGEFDPQYIRDLTRHTLAVEREAQKNAEREAQEQREYEESRAQLEAGWRTKMSDAQERYPDFQEKGQTLVSSFENVDPAYGEYLTATIMGMEYGPDVLYYLSNHHDEAERIVSSGPTQATIALGRIESKFVDAGEEKKQARPRVSKAPTPPSHLNKGSSVSIPEVMDDTDDLEAFSKKFFNKRGG